MNISDHPLGPAISELTSFINDPRNDRHLMAEAGLTFDPAFMPLLLRLGVLGEAGVVELAGQLGRDHSTISRQMAKLESAGLLERLASETDGRARTARLTSQGRKAFADLGGARRRLLDRVLADWTDSDREALGRLLFRFVRDLHSTVKSVPAVAD
jgi:DNA-binding MarR family transcriptional regulator